MNPETVQQSVVDRRNLIFSIAGLAAVFIFLTVFTELNPLKIPAFHEQSIPLELLQDEEVITATPVFPRTTVNIQPLVTRFPPLPDFNKYQQAKRRKAAFFEYLTPIIEYQNEKILRDRGRLEDISKLLVNGESLSDSDMEWLNRLAEKYDVDWKDNDPGSVVIRLARRVDIIPVSLALVQAAKESSWGRSRYAVEANNLFGQWCYDEGCGVVPTDRGPDAFHEVKKFKSVTDAARSYIHNLNTHPQYEQLRQIRQQLRMLRQPLTGKALADGLLYYSERREEYVDEVKQMIRQYRLFKDLGTG